MAKNRGIYRMPSFYRVSDGGILHVLDAERILSKRYFEINIPRALSVSEEIGTCARRYLKPEYFKLPYEFISFEENQNEL